MKYPPVKHKLPALFQLIVDQDNLFTELSSEPLIPFKQMRDLRNERKELSRAAEKVISDMKKDSSPTV